MDMIVELRSKAYFEEGGSHDRQFISFSLVLIHYSLRSLFG
jgi:hypothetical protein